MTDLDEEVEHGLGHGGRVELADARDRPRGRVLDEDLRVAAERAEQHGQCDRDRALERLGLGSLEDLACRCSTRQDSDG